MREALQESRLSPGDIGYINAHGTATTVGDVVEAEAINAVFAGSAGLIITSLIKSTKNLDIPAYYVMVTCAISAAALLTLRGDDHKRDLVD